MGSNFKRKRVCYLLVKVKPRYPICVHASTVHAPFSPWHVFPELQSNGYLFSMAMQTGRKGASVLNLIPAKRKQVKSGPGLFSAVNKSSLLV
jgi:hypothetical protein